ncbi:mitochondrial inner membrane protease subunit 2 isoform X4 [Pelodiscus sinensis]|uniref:mitochondrial inner membrane protease subunit 2 isoform X4 n=1 Tax=Pelodiscus sinensis TaxID=13735 RepID=UPI003F6C5F97
MAQAQGLGKRYLKAFFKGFFVAVPVTVTFLDRVACVARVEGASMQPSLNPGGRQVSDVVLLNHWSIRNYEVQRGDIVSLVIPWSRKPKPSWQHHLLQPSIFCTQRHQSLPGSLPLTGKIEENTTCTSNYFTIFPRALKSLLVC